MGVPAHGPRASQPRTSTSHRAAEIAGTPTRCPHPPWRCASNAKPRVMTPPLSIVPEPRRRRIPPLRSGVYILPNLFTTGCLVAGFYSIICTHDARYRTAAYMILLAQICDMLEGDRADHGATTLGCVHRSRPDAFGVAPAFPSTRGPHARGVVGVLAATRTWRGRLRCAIQRAGGTVESGTSGWPSPAAADVVATTVLLYTTWAARTQR